MSQHFGARKKEAACMHACVSILRITTNLTMYGFGLLEHAESFYSPGTYKVKCMSIICML